MASAERIVELVEMTKGGAFVLATSNRAMRNLCAISAVACASPFSYKARHPSTSCSRSFASWETPCWSPP